MSGWFEDYFATLTEGLGMWKWTHYAPIYERHFAKFANRRNVRLLEIGVASGGSMSMWRDFLGFDAHLYGVDNDPRCAADENTQVFTADQGDRGFWQRFREQVRKLDIVIDDGGHHFEGQTATLEELLPHMAPGGVYLIEDIYQVSNPLWDYLEKRSRLLHEWLPGDPANCPSASQHSLVTNEWQARIDSIHTYPFAAVIEFRETPLTTMTAPRRGSEWLP